MKNCKTQIIMALAVLFSLSACGGHSSSRVDMMKPEDVPQLEVSPLSPGAHKQDVFK